MSAPTPRRPRVGHIQFLNCLPIYWGLMRSGALLDFDLHKDTPDQLNAALVAGDLDIGPISLVEYLRHADDLLLLPDLAVGSDGPVLSVNLVSTKPLAEIRRVALGSTSRTGVLLAQMLLAERYGVQPEFFRCPPDLTEMLLEADAAVLIGDVALRALYEAPARGLTVTDLGQAWREWTGLPMVFAVWAVRRDFAEAHPGPGEGRTRGVPAVARSVPRRTRRGRRSRRRWETFDAATLASYFRALDFSLGERQIAGVREFAVRAAAAGQVPPLPDGGPEFVEPLTPHRAGITISVFWCAGVTEFGRHHVFRVIRVLRGVRRVDDGVLRMVGHRHHLDRHAAVGGDDRGAAFPHHVLVPEGVGPVDTPDVGHTVDRHRPDRRLVVLTAGALGRDRHRVGVAQIVGNVVRPFVGAIRNSPCD